MKKIMQVSLILLICVLLTGCEKQQTAKEDSLQPTLQGTPLTEKLNTLPSDSVIPDALNRENYSREFELYSVDAETCKKEAITVIFSASEVITPEIILTEVLTSLQERGIYIGEASTEAKEDSLIVNFLNEGINVNSYELEEQILDAIAQSLLDNLEAYNKIIYRVASKAYVSANFSFAEDYVYMER